MKAILIGIILFLVCGAFAELENYNCDTGLKEVPSELEKFLKKCGPGMEKLAPFKEFVKLRDKANLLAQEKCVSREAKTAVEQAYKNIDELGRDCVEELGLLSLKLFRMEQKCPSDIKPVIEELKKQKSNTAKHIFKFLHPELDKMKDLKVKCEKI